MSAARPTGTPRPRGSGTSWMRSGTAQHGRLRPVAAAPTGRLTPGRTAARAVVRHDGSLPFVVVHGLGRALVPAIELALHLDRVAPNVYSYAVHTSTVRLHDDVDPLNEVRRAGPAPRRRRVRA